MYKIRECSTCHWFDPAEGYCAQLEVYCHGHDGTACEEFQEMRRRQMQTIGFEAERAEEEY